MQVLCEVCERKPAVSRCRICGRAVCEDHISEDGVCAACIDLMCRVCNARLSVTSCIICGKPVCRECSLELEPGIRVCNPCGSLHGVRDLQSFRKYLVTHTSQT